MDPIYDIARTFQNDRIQEAANQRLAHCTHALLLAAANALIRLGLAIKSHATHSTAVLINPAAF